MQVRDWSQRICYRRCFSVLIPAPVNETTRRAERSAARATSSGRSSITRPKATSEPAPLDTRRWVVLASQGDQAIGSDLEG